MSGNTFAGVLSLYMETVPFAGSKTPFRFAVFTDKTVSDYMFISSGALTESDMEE